MQHLKANLVFLFLFISTHAIALEIYTPVYTRRDGIPSSRIYQVIQDRQGFLWLCTENGICRFNGNNFTRFDEGGRFADNGSFHVFPDSTGRS